MRRAWQILQLVFLLGFAGVLHAQVLDRIDVVSGASDAEITIRFSQKIQYLRHGPQGEVKDLRVYLRLVDSNIFEGDLMQDTLRSPKTNRVPFVTAIYPELKNGMLLTFSTATTYVLKPGVDGRSIVLTVPLLPLSKEEQAKAAKAPPVVALPPSLPKPSIPVVAAPPVAAVVTPPAAAVVLVPPPVAPVATASQPVEDKPAIEKPKAEVPGEPAAEYTPIQPEHTPAETETMAQAYLAEARQGLGSGNVALAINRLNRILGLPATAQTEAAQALIGEAREANGETFKAKAEYELYLKIFPNGPNQARVKQRLAALQGGAPAPTVAKPVSKDAGPAEWSYSGSVSAYYYTGKSQIETLTPPPPGELTFNKDTLSMTDQRSLITSINLNARRRDTDSDTRIVVRDTDNKNYLTPERSYNRLYSAYVERNDRKAGYGLRVGRQNPNGMGVLDRFDGVQGGYNLNADWRANAVVGKAVEFDDLFNKNFYGLSLDFLPQSGRPGASVYVIEQTIDKLVNRRAIGTELRVFDAGFNAYGTIDYDLLYRGINIAMVQANYLDGRGNNYFASYDYRRSPSYSLANALNAAPGVALKDMITYQGIDAVRSQVSDLSALSKNFSVGVTHPLTESWQVGADYRLSSISSTKAVDAVIPLSVVGTCLGTVDVVNDTCVYTTAPQAGSGDSHVVTLQAIGNNFLLRNATMVSNVSFIKAPTYSGQSYGFSYVLPLGDQWRIDSNLRYYTQRDDNESRQDRFSPSLKVAYQWRSSWYLEGEYGQESSKSTSVDPAAGETVSKVTRDYWYFGLRWDFR